MFNWLQRSLQKKKKKRGNRDDEISLHLDSALNLAEQFTPVRGNLRSCIESDLGRFTATLHEHKRQHKVQRKQPAGQLQSVFTRLINPHYSPLC